MQVSIIDTVPGAGGGNETVKPSQAVSDAFATQLQNALTQNSGTQHLRNSSGSELASHFTADDDPLAEPSIAPPGTEEATDDYDPELDAENPEAVSRADDRTDGDNVESGDGNVAALTIATEAQISQSRSRTGTAAVVQHNTASQQQGTAAANNASESGHQTGDVAKANTTTSNARPETATNNGNSGTASAQVIETVQNTVSRPSNTLAAAATVSAQTRASGKPDGGTATQTPTGPTREASVGNLANSGETNTSSANLAGKESSKEPGTARNAEASGNLLLNSTSGGKTASQYAVQPGRIAQSTATNTQAVTGETASSANAQQTPVTAPQTVSPPPLPTEAARQSANPVRPASMPISDTSSTATATGQSGTQSTTAAARPAVTAPTRPSPPAANLNEQISVQVQKAVSQGVDRIRIQLKPAELGRLDVQLEVSQDGRVAAIVNADRPETLDLLRRDSRGLQQALQDAGLQVDSGSLSFNLGGENTAAEEQIASGGGGTGENDGTTPTASDIGDSGDPEPGRRSSESMIDVEV